MRKKGFKEKTEKAANADHREGGRGLGIGRVEVLGWRINQRACDKVVSARSSRKVQATLEECYASGGGRRRFLDEP